MKKLDISDGSKALLKVAIENDKHKALTNNNTLVKTLETAKILLDFSKEEDDNKRIDLLNKHLNKDISDSHFLFLVAFVIGKIESEVSKLMKHKDTSKKIVTDYNSFILHAFGQTLSEIIWDKSETGASSYTGPEILDCLDYYESQDIKTIWTLIVKNYLANIMISYFAAAREKSKTKYPSNIEENLRSIDATKMAIFVFSDLTLGKDLESDIGVVISELQNLFIEVLRK